MNSLRFLIYQFLLFFSLMVVSVFSDKYISKPFSTTDLVAILVTAPLYLLIFRLSQWLFRHFDTMQIRGKILLSLIAFILAFLFIVLFENIWFATTKKMLFALHF